MTETIRVSELLVTSDRQTLDRPFFNQRLQKIGQALNTLGGRMDTYDETVDALIELGLDRIDQTLGPLLTDLTEAQSLGFLVGKAAGVSVSLTADTFANFVITTGAETFAPTPYLLAVDDSDYTNWGILSLLESGGQWTKETGDLSTVCVWCNKTQAATNWTISANSALLPAMVSSLADAQSARDAAVAANVEVQSALSDVLDALAAIEAGPVASVAGRTGIVTLSISDIISLTDALAAKAASSWVTAQLTGKQAASAKLDAFASLALAADKLIYATSASTLGTATLTDFARSILAAADASAVLQALGFQGSGGISAFARTLLDDTDASAMATTLGLRIGINTQAYDAQLTSGILQRSVSANTTLLLTDKGKQIYHPASDNVARTWTIPTGVFSIGDPVSFVNRGGLITIAPTTPDVLRLAGSSSVGNRTLATNGMATMLKTADTEIMISGVGLN